MQIIANDITYLSSNMFPIPYVLNKYMYIQQHFFNPLIKYVIGAKKKKTPSERQAVLKHLFLERERT